MSGKKKISALLGLYPELLKIHLCSFIALSAVFGHVMAGKGFYLESFLTGVFVFILACGSAVLNNIQDREFDKTSPRTCNRALPRKKLSIFHAGCLALVLTGAGLAGTLAVSGVFPALMGFFSMACYNGLYTPLKKRSLWAIVPGSFTGMLVPMIGWGAAGGDVLSKDIVMIMTIFGVWQIPHFFILLLKSRKAYPAASKKCAYPSYIQLFSKAEIKVQILIWTGLYSLSILWFLISGASGSTGMLWVNSLNALVVPGLLLVVLMEHRFAVMGFAFGAINLSMLVFMAAGIGDSFL